MRPETRTGNKNFLVTLEENKDLKKTNDRPTLKHWLLYPGF